MYVVLVGAGEVGLYISRILIEEGHDVAIVEANQRLCRQLNDELDALVIHGSGVSKTSLEQAGIRKAELVIAVTETDEVNLVACMIAAKLGRSPRTVARVRDVETYEQQTLQDEEMGLSMIVGPEQSVADQIVRQLSFDGAGEIRHFADGRIVILELPLSEDSPLVHETLAELADVFPSPSLVAGIHGASGLRIPRGDDQIRSDERADILTTPKNVDEFVILSGKPWHHVRHVLIVGCGTIGFRLATQLERQKLYPTIIEANRERAEWVSQRLAHSIVLFGDGTDPQLLREQLEETADAVVVLLDDDEKSVLIGLFAKHLGAKKVLVRSDKLAYAPIAHKLGIDALISPRRALANAILYFVRRGDTEVAQMLGDHEGEVIEFRIADSPANSELVRKPLKELNFPEGSLIGGIVRGEEVLIPDGDTVFEPGDDVFVFALLSAIQDVERIIR